MTSKGARALAPGLEALAAIADRTARVREDPVELPHRYRERADIEVAALLSAALAYGRVGLFKPKIEGLLAAMAPSPAEFVRRLDVGGARRLLEGFVYRFNVGTDVAVLLMGMGAALRAEGSLEAWFAEALELEGDLRAALFGFTRRLREAAPLPKLRKALGPERGLDHLLPRKPGPGAAKRLLLFLRWMVRGPDGVDFGLWRSVPSSALVIPLDTHVRRVARRLGLTSRRDLGWRTAEEITASLRWVDAADPVRFDFALCHHGMSGACPVRPVPSLCEVCPVRGSCRVGRRRRPGDGAPGPARPGLTRQASRFMNGP